MQYNPNNEELIEKVNQWRENPELMQEEFDSFINEKIENGAGLEWFEFLTQTYSKIDSEEKVFAIYNILLKLLKKDFSISFFLSKYFDLFQENSDTPFEPLTIATIIRDSFTFHTEIDSEEKRIENENHLKWSQICSGLYNEMKMPEKAFEMIQPHFENLDLVQKTSTLLYSNMPELIEQGKELAKDIDCDEMYEALNPAVVSAGSMKFYSGLNKDGLIHHFGAEDFRPKEFYKLKAIPNHKTANFNNKHIVVTTYRGMGDSMILSRFIPAFKKKYPDVKITIATEKSLIPLYKNANYIHRVGDIESCVGIAYDYCLGVNHLARYLREELVDENGVTPSHEWVAYPPTYDQKWDHLPKNLIGINWKSSQRLGGTGGGIRSQEKYLGRDIPYKEFSIIIDSYPDQKFVILNPDLTEEELSDLEFRSNVIIPQINDFGDTAALINRCDVIVSVDTSISTLSASMNKKTIVLAKFWCDYRWIYPNLWWNKDVAKVFRKDELNSSWVLPLFNTIKELKKYAKG